MKHTEAGHPLPASERAFAGEPSDRLAQLVDAAEKQTPTQRRADAEAVLDSACGIVPEPTAAEVAQQRLEKIATAFGYTSVAEMEADADIDDGDDDDDD